MGLLRTLLIIAIIFFAFRFIFRYLLPFLLTSYVNKKFKEMGKTYGFREANNKKEKEGEVTIEYTPNDKKKYPKGNGDYVDFEEIKD
ncbi:MAG TPA: hypothetical protein VHO72_04725 [Bacteroidales bacterium]|nr:hypothetical protein [Bacteroidales bacterium]